MLMFIERWAPVRAPEGEGTAPPSSQGPDLSDAERDEIMNFDPFAPPKDGGEEGSDSEAAKGAGKEGEQAPPEPKKPSKADEAAESSPQGVEGQAPTQPKEPAEKVDPAAEKLDRIADLLERQGQKAEPPAAAPAEPAVPSYNLSIPDDILDGLESDDPKEFRGAVSKLASGIANTIARDMHEAMRELAKQVTTTTPKIVKQQHDALTEQERVQQDFYGKFPKLNKPAIRGVVMQTGIMLAQQKGKAYRGYTPEFRDELGKLVMDSLDIKPDPAPAPKGAKPPRRQPYVAGSGARPDASDGLTEIQREMMDVAGIT